MIFTDVARKGSQSSGCELTDEATRHVDELATCWSLGDSVQPTPRNVFSNRERLGRRASSARCQPVREFDPCFATSGLEPPVSSSTLRCSNSGLPKEGPNRGDLASRPRFSAPSGGDEEG